MKSAVTTLTLAALTITAHAQSPDAPAPAPPAEECCAPPPPAPAALPPSTVAAAEPAGYAPARTPEIVDDDGWRAPVGKRFLHGFRIGWTYVMNFEEANRMNDGGPLVSVKDKYELRTPNMMLLGYEGFYRIIGHSWINVLLVGNVTVAGLEQSKFIPAASGLIGAEFNESFQVGVGVNLTPDPDAPTHAILAFGWTPRIGAIHTPIHFFFVPEPGAEDPMTGDFRRGNHRVGATVGVTW